MAFRVRLGRLLAHRRADPATVARAAGLPAPEVEAVLAGDSVSAALLRRLAPALGLHAADLFVIADRDVPVDLAPASGTHLWHVGQVMRSAMGLYGERFDRMHEFIRSLPVLPPVEPLSASTRSTEAFVRRLLANRNIRPHIAHLLCAVGDGPYVSDSTICRVLNGDTPLTPRYVTAFAAVLGLRPGDLAALTGVGPPAESTRLYPRRHRLAALAWDARRLNSEQLSQVQQLAAFLARVGTDAKKEWP
ncbi:hypothetical protein [Actinoplanes regularis]|uniref:hypothetical protein n=1 Tax=Actinoplanes regularis TaxID=52697 RepID=UPI002555232B|nr:hypothetical protein [Actinoplanes regularis]